MTDSVIGPTLRRLAYEESASLGVFWRFPRPKTNPLLNLKEEVDFKTGQEPTEPTFIEAVCGIVGQLHSGRRHLGERFGKMNEEVIDKVWNDKQLCYCGNFDTFFRGKPIQAVIKAYIIPPPYSEPEKLPLYARASNQFCCLLFAFDVTRPGSLDAVKECIRNMKISLPEKYFLVGNKCDLRGTVQEGKEVPTDFAKIQAEQMGAFGYFECSAKLNTNVKEIMNAIVRCECERPHL